MQFANPLVLTGSGKVSYGEQLLSGFVIVGSASPSVATFYDGQDPSAGKKIMTVKCSANDSKLVMFDPPIKVYNGLYVDFTTSITEVSVLVCNNKHNSPYIETYSNGQL